MIYHYTIIGKIIQGVKRAGHEDGGSETKDHPASLREQAQVLLLLPAAPELQRRL